MGVLPPGIVNMTVANYSVKKSLKSTPSFEINLNCGKTCTKAKNNREKNGYPSQSVIAFFKINKCACILKKDRYILN